MRIDLKSIATIGKSLTIKREKDSNDVEIVVAHLKFSGAFLQRDQIDELCQLERGWAQSCLFWEDGLPRGHMSIDLLKFSGSVTGSIGDSKAKIMLANAELTDVSFTLTKLGASLDGHLAWPIAGDEASDVESLLGQECEIHWLIVGPEQSDWVTSLAKKGINVSVSVGGANVATSG